MTTFFCILYISLLLPWISKKCVIPSNNCRTFFVWLCFRVPNRHLQNSFDFVLFEEDLVKFVARYRGAPIPLPLPSTPIPLPLQSPRTPISARGISGAPSLLLPPPCISLYKANQKLNAIAGTPAPADRSPDRLVEFESVPCWHLPCLATTLSSVFCVSCDVS